MALDIERNPNLTHSDMYSFRPTSGMWALLHQQRTKHPQTPFVVLNVMLAAFQVQRGRHVHVFLGLEGRTLQRQSI